MQKTSNLFILNVQFCKSCDTHNWCTHHDEQKYLNTYKKLKQHLEKQFGPDIFVQGNVIPQELVPIKPAQNKYFNTKTNKYVTFPTIGAFQVMLQNQLIFSKKKTNTWPNFTEISDKVYAKLNGKERQRSPTRKFNTTSNSNERVQTADADIKTEKDNLSLRNQSFLDHTDKRSTFYKTRPQQQKNFTLTDHFKNYHNGNYKSPHHNDSHRVSDEFFATTNTDNENQSSEISSFRNVNSSQKDFLEFKKNFQMFGLDGKVPQFLKKKGYMKEDLGKKEMIIRLDSIEEESLLVDDGNNGSYGQNINLTNTHSTFKSKSKDSHKKLMKRFNDDFEQLEQKFKRFQQRVQTIRQENKKFDHTHPNLHRDASGKLNQKIMKELNEIKKKQKRMRSSQMKDTMNDYPHSQIQEEDENDLLMQDNPILFARKKLKNIEDYINGTEEQKNEKLKRIYGEWKLLKKPFKGKNYVSPYKIQVPKNNKNSTKDKLNKETTEQSQFSSSESSSSEQKTTENQTKTQSKLQRLPKMSGITSPKSNQVITTQDKFYSTARDKFQEMQSKKLNKKNKKVKNSNQKNFNEFAHSSTQNQFHRASAGVKINTFDHLSQMPHRLDDERNEDLNKNYPHSYDNQKEKSAQKGGRFLKSINKNKEKQNFLTRQTSSRGRKMSSTSKKIPNEDDQINVFISGQKKLKNSASASGNLNSFSQKSKNFRSKKKQNVSVSKSKSKDKFQGQMRDKMTFRNQEIDSQSRSGEDAQPNNGSSGEQMVEQSHQNSQSLTNNFLSPQIDQYNNDQNGKQNIKKQKGLNSRTKQGYERSIGQMKDWKQGDAQRETKINSKSKPGRKLVGKNKKQINQQQQWRKSFELEENINSCENSQNGRSNQQIGSENKIITTHHKLQKKSKIQRLKQLEKLKKSTKSKRKDQQTDEQEQNLKNVKASKGQKTKEKVSKQQKSNKKRPNMKKNGFKQKNQNKMQLQESSQASGLSQKEMSDNGLRTNQEQKTNKLKQRVVKESSMMKKNSNSSRVQEKTQKSRKTKKQQQSQSENQQNEHFNSDHSQSMSNEKEHTKAKQTSVNKKKTNKFSAAKKNRSQNSESDTEQQLSGSEVEGSYQQSEEQTSEQQVDSYQGSSEDAEQTELNEDEESNQEKLQQRDKIITQNKKGSQNKHQREERSLLKEKDQATNSQILQNQGQTKGKSTNHKVNKLTNQGQQFQQSSQQASEKNVHSATEQKDDVENTNENDNIVDTINEDQQNKLTRLTPHGKKSENYNQQNKKQKGSLIVKKQGGNKVQSQDQEEEKVSEQEDDSQEDGQSQQSEQEQQSNSSLLDSQTPAQNIHKNTSSKLKKQTGQDKTNTQQPNYKVKKNKQSKKEKQDNNYPQNDPHKQLVEDQSQSGSTSKDDQIEKPSSSQLVKQDQNNDDHNQPEDKWKTSPQKHSIIENPPDNGDKSEKIKEKVCQHQSNSCSLETDTLKQQSLKPVSGQQDKTQQAKTKIKKKNNKSKGQASSERQKQEIKQTGQMQQRESLSGQSGQDYQEEENFNADKQNEENSQEQNAEQMVENRKEQKLKQKQQCSKEAVQNDAIKGMIVEGNCSTENGRSADIQQNLNPKTAGHSELPSNEMSSIENCRQDHLKVPANQDCPRTVGNPSENVPLENCPQNNNRVTNTSRTNRSKNNKNRIINSYDTDRFNNQNQSNQSNDQNQGQLDGKEQENLVSNESKTLNKKQFYKYQQEGSNKPIKEYKDVGIQMNNNSMLNLTQKGKEKDQMQGQNSDNVGTEAKCAKNVQSTEKVSSIKEPNEQGLVLEKGQKQVNQSKAINEPHENKASQIESTTENKPQQNLRQKDSFDSPTSKHTQNAQQQKQSQPQLELQQKSLRKSNQNKKKASYSDSVNEREEKAQNSIKEQDKMQQASEEMTGQQLQNLTKKIVPAPITKQFYGESFQKQIQKLSTYLIHSKHTNLSSHTPTFLSTLPPNSYLFPLPIIQARKSPIILFNPKSIETSSVVSNHPLTNLIKCLKILSDINEFLIIRLFENPFVKLQKETLLDNVFGVWLCVDYEWKCVLVCLKDVLLVGQAEGIVKKDSLYFLKHQNQQLWPIVLQLALAKALNGYQKLASLPCHKLFNILTGSNSLFFNIKQDPTKNGRILRYISDCQNKNFVLHAEKVCKNLEELQNKDKQAKIYYVLSQRTVNDNDILLQIRESSRGESQWIKLTKFVQEFKSIQILQLRINHNFSSVSIPKPYSTSNITVISLSFDRESFGSITLSTEPQPTPLMKTYLYKEQQSNCLKLVGQAQQKNKSTLFFDCCFSEGRYWLFVECGAQAKVVYLGENQPAIEVVQEVEGDGLKNDWTEYLPVKMGTNNGGTRISKENFQSTGGFKMSMPYRMTRSKFGQTGTSFRSQEDKISKLRENFVEYLLKGKQ